MAEIEAVGLCNNLVTHGTYTMQETAKYLHDRRVASSHKVVCLTGGMCTLLGTVGHRGYFMPSDGPFNLGFAMGALPNLEGGIYQAMNGEIFRAPDEWWMHSDKGVSYCKNGKVTELPH
jgi:L-asparaginase/Glu-tRNA(Gln) amidotransferase subunit D